MTKRSIAFVFYLSCIIALLCSPAETADLGSREAAMWIDEEWSLANPSWDGNPFDTVAKVRFVHPASKATRRSPKRDCHAPTSVSGLAMT